MQHFQQFDKALGVDAGGMYIEVPCMNLAGISEAMRAVQSIAPEVANNQIVYDMDSISTTISSCKNCFDDKIKLQLSSVDGFVSPFVHCFAVKACPVSYILHTFIKSGFGMECASINEVRQSLRCECPPCRIVFDSPCKTAADIAEAISAGINFNVNSVNELEKVQQVWSMFEMSDKSSLLDRYIRGDVCIGLRVNPLVGAGSIAALSVATAFSKFGIPLYSMEYIADIYRKYAFLNGIMCHVGSQGMSIESMVRGVRALLDVTQILEDGRLKSFDIGGGLSVDYTSDSILPSFEQYASALLASCPELFLKADLAPAVPRPSNQWRIFTEFGKSLISKTACVVSRVEDVIYHNIEDRYLDQDTGAETNEPQVTAVIHAGADLFLRQCYCPDKFIHRVAILDSQFRPTTDDRVLARRLAIAGPLCFGGDIVQRSVSLHLPQCGDFVVAMDAGANTLSLFSRHCSRNSPAVYAVRRISTEERGMVACKIRDEETTADVCAFWG